MSKQLSRRRFVIGLATVVGATALGACGDATPTFQPTTAALAATTKAVAPTTGATTVGNTTAAAAPHWEYEGAEGPTHWGDLEGYAVCKTGQKQTPIDITTATKLSPPQDLTLNYKDTVMKLVNNGHTAQVNYDSGSTMAFQGKTYDLIQFHFHDPSEHHLNGTAFGMELHLVHQNAADKSLAVVGVMLKEGAENPFLAKFWNDIPAKAGTATATTSLNVKQVVPTDSHFYTYAGSLTTPPCSEGVRWLVMKQPMDVSKAQIEQFHTIFGNNARPIQALNNREVGEE